MKKRLFLVIAGLVLLSMVVGCTPKAPAPTFATAGPTPGAQATPIAQALTPEEAAWARVVEAAKKEGIVNAYSFHFITDVGAVVNRAFQQKYNIKVEFVTGPGMALAERIKAERQARKRIADIYTTSTAILFVAKGEGLLETVGDLPALRQKDVWISDPRLDPEANILSFALTFWYPFINTQLVKKEDYPKAYRELLAPRWKGKVVIADPNVSPTVVRFYWVMTDRKILDRAYFEALARQQPRIVPTERENLSAMVRGEGLFTLVGSSTVAGALAAEKAPMQALAMEEGTLTGAGSGISLVKDAAHPNAARLFINWIMSAEGQELFTRAANTASVRQDVPVFLPEAVKAPIKRVVLVTPNDDAEASRLMRERVLPEILGLGR